MKHLVNYSNLSSDYLNDIVEYAAKAESFLSGITLKNFKANEEKTLAVIRALEVIGEAARNIPKQIRKKYPEVPWDEMTGMRDKLIHDYFGVNLPSPLSHLPSAAYSFTHPHVLHCYQLRAVNQHFS
jgi:uncharacterized protein with HEPN domain